MPSSEPASERDSDLAEVPAFLRGGGAKRPIAIPRPSTPAPSVVREATASGIDPAALPMPSLSRRRLVTAAAVIVGTLLALSFLRQVGAATDASNHATDLRAGNAVLEDEVARLQRDLGHVQDPRYILLAGRAFGLGGPRAIPFALAAGAPALDANAPGSASVRLGAPPHDRTPLDTWLEVLFGPR